MFHLRDDVKNAVGILSDDDSISDFLFDTVQLEILLTTLDVRCAMYTLLCSKYSHLCLALRDGDEYKVIRIIECVVFVFLVLSTRIEY